MAYKRINHLPYLNLKLDGFHMLEVTKVVLYTRQYLVPGIKRAGGSGSYIPLITAVKG